MVTTKTQIARLAARIDELARRADDRPEVTYIWQETSETREEALARHFAIRPEDRRAKQIVTIGWRGRRKGDPDGNPAADSPSR